MYKHMHHGTPCDTDINATVDGSSNVMQHQQHIRIDTNILASNGRQYDALHSFESPELKS